MITRKQFVSGFTLVGLGLIASPLLAVGQTEVLTERETAELELALQQLVQGHSTEQVKPWLNLQPEKILSREETRKGFKTTYRARNGSMVVLENFGQSITRFY